ncbi:hypothetical protein HQ571_01455 [Candidatus Kuenenbacteria bacterium]|nr:hypothetical protein [Candidatus Kuenenbacteria bacterium]
MIRVSKSNLVSPISDAFWPVFFSSELIVRFVAQAVCFALCDKKKKPQLIFVYPYEGSSSRPTAGQLLQVFQNCKDPWREFRPFALPVKMSDLLDLTGVNIECVQDDSREVVILYANKQPKDEIDFSDSMLVSGYAKADLIDMRSWPENPEEYTVHSAGFEPDGWNSEHYRLFVENYVVQGDHICRILALARIGCEVELSPTVRINARSKIMINPPIKDEHRIVH